MTGRWEVIVESYFSSAHNLKGYDGDCERLHGHNWRVEMAVGGVEGKELDDTGLLVDFRVLKKLLRGVLDGLDHCYLNEHPAFAEINPSTENLARYIAEEVTKDLPEGVCISWVRVWENPTTRSVFYPE